MSLVHQSIFWTSYRTILFYNCEMKFFPTRELYVDAISAERLRRIFFLKMIVSGALFSEISHYPLYIWKFPTSNVTLKIVIPKQINTGNRHNLLKYRILFFYVFTRIFPKYRILVFNCIFDGLKRLVFVGLKSSAWNYLFHTSENCLLFRRMLIMQGKFTCKLTQKID